MREEIRNSCLPNECEAPAHCCASASVLLRGGRWTSSSWLRRGRFEAAGSPCPEGGARHGRASANPFVSLALAGARGPRRGDLDCVFAGHVVKTSAARDVIESALTAMPSGGGRAVAFRDDVGEGRLVATRCNLRAVARTEFRWQVVAGIHARGSSGCRNGARPARDCGRRASWSCPSVAVPSGRGRRPSNPWTGSSC